MGEFNLIDEAWIPCVSLEGTQVEYGIRETLLRAHELREVCDDSPLVTAALHRLLLAILYRAHGGPSDMAEWRDIHDSGAFAANERVESYLTRWHERFFLFDDSHPFMQVAGLELNEHGENDTLAKDKSDGLMRLAREAPDKGGRILFDHRMSTQRIVYQPQAIARMIMSAQSYSGTGIALGGRIHAQKIAPTPCQFGPCVDGLVLWLQGANLFDTLLLNLVPYGDVSDILPVWEDDAIVDLAIKSWGRETSFSGPAQRFAPLSRFIRVIDRESLFFTNGLKTANDAGDPMKAYSRPSDKSPFRALRLTADKAVWRDAHTLLALDSAVHKKPAAINHVARLMQSHTIPQTMHAKANVVGLATDQGKALLWRHDRMPLPFAVATNSNVVSRLGTLTENAEEVGRQLNSRVWRIARLYRVSADHAPNRSEKEDIRLLAQKLDPRFAYWARLEQHFYTLLNSLPCDLGPDGQFKPDDEQDASRTWREHVKSEAQRSLEESVRSLGTSARALQAIARVRTSFTDNDLAPQSQRISKAISKRRW